MLQRLVRGARGRDVDLELLAEPLQLQQCRRAAHVGGHEQDALLFARLEPQRDLRRRRRLAGALQAREQHDGGRLRAQVERAHALAHHAHEFVVDDLDQRLAGREALVDLLADDLRLDAVDEGLDDRQRDVRLEQRHAHLAQRVGDVFLGQPAAAAKAFDDGRKTGGKLVEHALETSVGAASPDGPAGECAIIGRAGAGFTVLLSPTGPWHHACRPKPRWSPRLLLPLIAVACYVIGAVWLATATYQHRSEPFSAHGRGGRIAAVAHRQRRRADPRDRAAAGAPHRARRRAVARRHAGPRLAHDRDHRDRHGAEARPPRHGRAAAVHCRRAGGGVLGRRAQVSRSASRAGNSHSTSRWRRRRSRS